MKTLTVQGLEGEVQFHEHGDQVTVELTGDCWHGAMTIDSEAIAAIHDWFVFQKMNRQ